MKRLFHYTAPMMLLFSALASAGPVNINTASAKQIAAELKGVGEVKAQAIVDYRAAHGPFRSATELVKVKGIGKGTVKMNRSNILLGKRKGM